MTTRSIIEAARYDGTELALRRRQRLRGDFLGDARRWFDSAVNSTSAEGDSDRPDPAWRTRSSTVAYHTPRFDVHSDEVVGPDGVDRIYEHVVVTGSVTVLAYDNHRIPITRQWVYTHGGAQWRLPGGGIEACDPDPLSAARRELREETGLRAGKLTSIGCVHGADSLSNHVDHVFLATGLTPGPADLEPTEGDLSVCWLSLDRAVELVTSGQLRHAGSAYALLFLALQGMHAAQRQFPSASRSIASPRAGRQ
jgi:8-oxo-dGTP pyrophosphatase MutT (NUDIX family)